MAGSEMPRREDAPLTRTQASALLRHWLGRGVVCREIKPLEGGICGAVFRLEFDINGEVSSYNLEELESSPYYVEGTGSYTTSAGSTTTAVMLLSAN